MWERSHSSGGITEAAPTPEQDTVHPNRAVAGLWVMHLWTNPAKPRQQEEKQKALQLTSGRAWGHIRQLHQEPGKGSRAAV